MNKEQQQQQQNTSSDQKEAQGARTHKRDLPYKDV